MTSLSSMQTRLHIAISCPDSLIGAAVAAKTVTRCVKNAASAYSKVVSDSWLASVVEYAKQLNASAKKDSRLMYSSSDDRIYGAFAAPAKPTLETRHLDEVYAAMGLAIVSCASNGKPIPPKAVIAWSRLLASGAPRAGRHPHWEEFARSVPADLESVHAWQLKTTEKDLLQLLATMEFALQYPPQEPESFIYKKEISSNDSNRGSDEDDHNSVEEQQGRKKDRNVLPQSSDNFVGWLVQRSNLTEFTGHFGIDDRWDQQSIEEIKYVCKQLDQILKTQTSDLKYAYFAVVCLVSSLPADLAINIQLSANSDLWICIERAMLRWCLLRVTNAKRVKTIAASEINESDIVDILFPRAMATVGLYFLKQHPDANSVIELLTGLATKDAAINFIDEYRSFLKSLAPRSGHRVLDARWARSIGHVYRKLYSDVIAAFCALNFDECALGMIPYVRISTSKLHECSTAVYASLGFEVSSK